MGRRTKVVVASVAALAVMGGGAGTAYAVQHQDRALPHTSIAGMDVGGQTLAQVTQTVQAKADAARLTVVTPQGRTTASLAELGYTVDAAATAHQVLEGRDLSTYARALVSDHALATVVATDPAKLRAYTAGLVPAERTRAKNAAVRLAADTQSFVVVPAVTGASIDPQPIEVAAAATARDLVPRTVQVNLRDVAPDVTTQAAQALADTANALVTTTVKVSLGDATYSPSTAERASWVTLPANASGTPEIKRDKVAAWVGARAKAARISPVDGSRLLTSSGTVVRVTKDKVDGRTVTNSEDIVARLMTSLSANKAYRGQFASKAIPASWQDRRIAEGAQNLAYQAAAGEKWIDVNLSRHTLTAYVGGKVALGPVAMVNGAAATPSIVGTHYINRKYVTDRMRGSNTDGSQYDIADVPWVLYFQGGYALHGAPWRPSFGYAASHGCINLPVSTAKWVYDWAPMGTPVVSHT